MRIPLFTILSLMLYISLVSSVPADQEKSRTSPSHKVHQHDHHQSGNASGTKELMDKDGGAHHHHHQATDQTVLDKLQIGVTEKLGIKLPSGLTFKDSHGKVFNFDERLDKPTIILPVFYHCTATCGIMMAELTKAIPKIPRQIGKEYQVIALSFDEDDNPEFARITKKNYSQALLNSEKADDYYYITGDLKNITSFTSAIGYRFKRMGKENFVHPNALVVISEDKKVIRYLYGPYFLPFDLGMAISEAQKGTPALSVRKLISYCFTYEPEKKRYSFRLIRISTIAVLTVLAIFLFFLLRGGRKNAH